MNEIVAVGESVYFVALITSQYGNLLSVRTRRSSFFQQNPFSKKSRNAWLPFGMLTSLTIAILFVEVPAFNQVFGTRPIPAPFWFAPYVTSLVVFSVDELRKYGKRTYPHYFNWTW